MPKQIQENLLIEIGTEEIPARFLQQAALGFKGLVVKFFQENRIAFDENNVKVLFTPRRLTVFFPQVASCQKDYTQSIKGPPVSVAVDAQGQWTKAALAFAERQGSEARCLVRKSVEKGEYVFVEKHSKGQSTFTLLKENLGRLICGIRFPKSMRWGTGNIFFARPISWVVALLGAKVVPFKLESLASGRVSRGFRWAKNPKLSIPKADLFSYLKAMKSKGVWADFEERLTFIREELQKVLGKNMTLHEEDHDLLIELSNLVECPNVGIGDFDPEFLRIPQALLATAVRYHQKYLPLYDRVSGKLLPKFAVIFNGPKNVSQKVVRGNQRVLRARLADAAFFWDQDQKKKLSDRVEDLKQVVFQEKLGTYFDKKERLVFFAALLSDRLKLDQTLASQLKQSAVLCKADLVTAMVGEFPALQGIMGGEYAHVSGEDFKIAEAIREHYLPLSGSEGALPKTQLGALLALIDKLDTVIVSFKAGLMPTGSQDPYGLRRLSSGLLRILYEHKIPLSLDDLIQKGFELAPHASTSSEAVIKFFQERLENLFLALGFHHELVRAVVERQSNCPSKAYEMARAIQGIMDKPFLLKAVAVIERTSNILKGQAVLDGPIQEALLKEPEEIALYRGVQSNYDSISNLIQSGDFAQATHAYAEAFSEPVHLFFDKVLVNVPEVDVRKNRLILLKKIHALYADKIADLSKIKCEK